MSFNVTISGHVSRETPTTDEPETFADRREALLAADTAVIKEIQACLDRLAKIKGATGLRAFGSVGETGAISLSPTPPKA